MRLTKQALLGEQKRQELLEVLLPLVVLQGVLLLLLLVVRGVLVGLQKP